MITGRQIRAARSLLGWDATSLADKAGVTRETVSRIETDSVQPQEKTLTHIRLVLENEGIEFLPFEGMRFRPEGVDVLTGREGLIAFLNEVYEHLQLHGGEICATGIDEDQWIKSHGIANAKKHIAHMDALSKKQANIRIRSLTQEGNFPSSTSSYTEYRWISRDRFNTIPFYLCGDKLGIIVFQSDPPPKIILIRSSVVANAYRQQFEDLWDAAKKIPNNHEASSHD